MSKSRHTTAVCAVIVALTLALTVLFMNGEALGLGVAERETGYEARLFDTSFVHTIDIVMDEADWQSFLDTAQNEEYVLCSLVIDGEAVKNVALRAKGNTSLSNVSSYGNDRYSLKAEFDHYEAGKTYYGLDKLVLNNLIQDNTLMKDYLTYRMMAKLGVNAPLVSYAYVTVNGEAWGLYLALEAVEEAFLNRNYGGETGELYKPDSMSMGGGRGNGAGFDMEDFAQREGIELPGGREGRAGDDAMAGPPELPASGLPEGGFRQGGGFPGGERPEAGDMPGGERPEAGDMPGGMASGDVSLIYTDDDPASYPNIFNNAKTAVTAADKTRLISALKRLNANETNVNQGVASVNNVNQGVASVNMEETVDVEQVIRYFAVHNFVLNFDSYTGSMIHNYYLYEENGVLSMIPWDYNLAFGGFVGGSDATSLVNYPIDDPVSGGETSSRPMLAWIFQSEEYTALYHECLEELVEGFFQSGEFAALFEEAIALISPYAEADENGFCTDEEFELGAQTLRAFCLLRAESVAGQLEGAIPATKEGQNAETSAFVDASHLSVSDMGGMGGMGGGGISKR